MSEMKLIMEGWRGYLEEEMVYPPLFERHAYITGVLGIALPLDESGAPQPLTEALKQQILQEQLLFEGFWDDVVQVAKTKAGEMKATFVDAVDGVRQFGKDGWNIIQQLYRVATNENLISHFLGAIWRKGITPIMNKIRDVATQLQQLLPQWGMSSLAAIITKGFQILEKLVKSANDMSPPWKQVIAISGLAVAFRWLWGKVKDFVDPYMEQFEKIKDVINDPQSTAVEEFKNWLKDNVQEKLTNYLGSQFPNMVKKLTSVASGVGPWWDAAVKAVGAVQIVIDALSGGTARFKRRTSSTGFQLRNELNL